MRKVLDHETKQLLLSAVDRGIWQLTDQANELLRDAARHEREGEQATAAKLRERAEVYNELAGQLRGFWNDARPVDVLVALTRSQA
jgi:hypothetical protein